MLVDAYGVLSRREVLRGRAAHVRFAPWWSAHLARQRERLAQPLGGLDASESPAAQHRRLGALADEAAEVAFAACLAADDQLGGRAADLLRRVADDELPWMSPEHKHHYPELDADLLVAERTKRLVAAASWANDWLTDADRDAVAHALRSRGGGVIFRDSERGAWWADAWNSNWCAVLNSGLGWAALYLDEPTWLARANAAIARVLSISDDDGSGVEGIGYWCYCFTSALDQAEVSLTAGDHRLWQHPFWSRAVEFPLHMALPDRSGWANFGDCGYPGLGGSSLLYAIAARTGDGSAQWLADRICNGRVGQLDFVRCDPEVVPVPPDDQPPCRRFVTAQLASLRSDWSADATHFVLKGGSNAWSHCHLDLNSFIVTARGERLAIDPGPWPYTPHYWTSVEPPQSTAWHNTITVDGADQRQPPRYRLTADLAEGGEAYSRLDCWADNDWGTIVRGDATSAYADTLSRCHRWVVYLKPDTFLLYDDLRCHDVRTQRHFQWLLHAELPVEDTPDGILVRGQRSTLHARFLLPQPAVWKHLPDRRPIGHGERPPAHAVALRQTFHHLWNVSPQRTAQPHWTPSGQPRLYGPDYRFLVLLTVTAPGLDPEWTVAVTDAPEGPAARLQRADEDVMVRFCDTGTEVVRGHDGATMCLAAGPTPP